MPSGRQDEYDIFILESIFPDPESIFKFQLKPVQELKTEAVIILDTNALLVPFTVGMKSLDNIHSIYKRLVEEDRLIIPSQVAREFAKNRGTKLAETITALRQITSKQISLNLGHYPLLESIETFIDLKEQQKKINKGLEEFYRTLNELISHIKEWRWNDPVTLMYGEIFSKKIFFDPQMNKEDLEIDLKRRILHDIPPGFQDKDKPDRGIGDVLIWHTILEIGKKKNIDVIFVSNDLKDDWWHKDSKNKKETLYPRYELIDEFRHVSKGRSFHIITFLQFLKLFEAGKDVIDEVEKAKDFLELSKEYRIENAKVIALRVAIEKKLRELISVHELDIDTKRRPIIHLVRYLVDKKVLPEYFEKDIMKTYRISSIAVHGGEISPYEAEYTTELGSKILEILKKLIISKKQEKFDSNL